MIKNRGFQPDKIREEDYVLGRLSQEVLQEDGDWSKYLPRAEDQVKYGFDTMACVSFGIANVTEILLKRLYGKKENYSDRYLAIMSKTTPTGNTPNAVCDALRDWGCVDESVLPFENVKSWSEYMSPNAVTKGMTDKGLEWLKSYDFGHEWVFTSPTPSMIQTILNYLMKIIGMKPENLNIMSIKEALKYSPVGASVYAWKQRNGLYYKELYDRDTHWITIFDYKEGEYWRIFDNEDRSIKKLEWNYPFGYAKRFRLKKKI